MTDTRIRTSLAGRIGASPTTETEMQALRRRAWREDGFAGFTEEQRAGMAWDERAIIERAAERLYGAREQ